jgi:hypothetical protein
VSSPFHVSVSFLGELSEQLLEVFDRDEIILSPSNKERPEPGTIRGYM